MKRMISMMAVFSLAALLFPGSKRAAEKAITLPENLEALAKPLFADTDGALVIYDLKHQRYSRYNPDRCATRLPPCSTFKIPNSLISLETGVVDNGDSVIPFDSLKFPEREEWINNGFAEWIRDHSLRSAFKYSVVWYFQELARRVGSRRMQDWLNRMGYGNRDISGGIDRFWLVSSLLISADEQIDFLVRFYRDELGISQRSTAIVKDIMLRERNAGYRLCAKTGGGMMGDHVLGWYVGYLETKNNVYFFALNLDGKTFAEIVSKRIEWVKTVFRQAGIIGSPISGTR